VSIGAGSNLDPPWRCAPGRRSGNGLIANADGQLRYNAGRDWIVEHSQGDYTVVRADIFARMYADAGEGRFRRRDDVRMRYFRLPTLPGSGRWKASAAPNRAIGSSKA
jgi:hypothetical protein